MRSDMLDTAADAVPVMAESRPSTRSQPRPARSQRDSQSARRRRIISTAILYGLLVVLAIPFLYPTLWMVFSSFKPTSEIFAIPPTLWPQTWTLDGWSKVFTANPFARQYANSLVLAAIITAGTVLVSALAGYAFARMRFPLAGPLFILTLAGIMVPADVTIIPIFQVVNSWGLVDTYWPLIILPIFGPGAVVSTFIFRQFFLGLPLELEEAARLDGLGRLGIFARVAMPLAGPAIATVTIMTFLKSFNMYFEPLIFLRTAELFPIGLGLTRYQDGYGEPLWTTQLGATTLSVIPVLIVFFFAQKQFVEGLTRSGLKG
ncbi:carbohydrate ABC transporter permease [Microbacterium jejuense]|uniref:Carbohydrate ABC transporter permease n=2 Tax=Microbacterium jejuense TaxID=1263637 RepID=A0ABS7HHV8_9MICO|nr:carbohydrate ABC transporter permease [Microbacterium jejuense]